jgi:glycosyltransferase involved in cell wall biosynthesis
VLLQSHQDFELIIVDDGSTDNGPEIVKHMEDSRIMLISQNNGGASAARNCGIEASSGELVAFLDADDAWEQDFLETIIKLRDKYPNAGLYATAYQIVTVVHKKINPVFKGIGSHKWEGIIPNYFRSAAFGAPPVWTSAACVQKRILKECGGFALGKRMGEDVDLWGRIALRYPIALSTKIGAIYYQNAENSACLPVNRGRLLFSPKDEHPFLQTVKTLRCTHGIPEKMDDDLELYMTRLRLENVRQHVLAGNFKRARELSAEISNRLAFPMRQLLWVSYLNSITRFVWYLRYHLLS